MKPSASLRPRLRDRVTPVRYSPPTGYGHRLELVAASELRCRAGDVNLRGIERIDFHCLIYVTAGQYRHTVDFETFACSAGSVLIIQPGQVHRFGDLSGWRGWLLIFQSDLLQPRQASLPIAELELAGQVESLPTQLHTSGVVRQALTEAFKRMIDDAKPAGTAAAAVNALLRSQLYALLIRLHLARSLSMPEEHFEPMVLQRYRRFRLAVEQEYPRWHQVAQYARHLGCSHKSLSRSTLEVADMSAKSMLVNRIVLEAKRLLVYTVLPVSVIGDQLGFAEATNFVKFFRRETGSTPGAFRARQGIAG